MPNVTALPKTLAPMVLWTHGCAGSSAAMVMARDIAELSDHPVLNCGGGYELLADIAKGYYGPPAKGEVFRGFVKRAAFWKRSLLFKGETHYALQDTELMPYLSRMRARVASMYRQNAIDVALCAVHDCFSGWLPHEFGYAVNASGKRSEGCGFRGRTKPGDENATETQVQKVVVDPEFLLENLYKITSDQGASNTFLKNHGYKASVDHNVTSEDLFAFHGGIDKMQTSVDAWRTLMQALGVTIDSGKVRSYLGGLMSTHEKPLRHSDMIYNIDAVKTAINECVIPKGQKHHGKEYRTPKWCAKVKAMLRE